MHEFSLAQGLHDQLVGLVKDNEVSKVLLAEVQVGRSSGIVVESFLFGFNVLAEQHEMTKGMDLKIIDVDGGDLILLRVEIE